MSGYGNYKRQTMQPLKTGQQKIYKYTKQNAIKNHNQEKTTKETTNIEELLEKYNAPEIRKENNKTIYNDINPVSKKAWDENEFLFYIKNSLGDKFIILYSQDVTGVQIEEKEASTQKSYTTTIIIEDYEKAKMMHEDILSMHTFNFDTNINFKEIIEACFTTHMSQKLLEKIDKRIIESRNNNGKQKPIEEYESLKGGLEVYTWAEKNM